MCVCVGVHVSVCVWAEVGGTQSSLLCFKTLPAALHISFSLMEQRISLHGTKALECVDSVCYERLKRRSWCVWHWNTMTLLGSEHSILIRSKFKSGEIFASPPTETLLHLIRKRWLFTDAWWVLSHNGCRKMCACVSHTLLWNILEAIFGFVPVGRCIRF